MSEKEIFINNAISKIRSKNLKEPIQLNPGVVIVDLEKYLSRIRTAMMATEKKKILKIFIHKLNELINYEN